VLRSPGKPLDASVRTSMEGRFRHDFGDIRVHADTPAAESAAAVSAEAYTVGRDLVFGHGRFAPSTPSGRRLLAHELAHAVQQSGRGDSSGPIEVVPDDHPSELEARRAEGDLEAGGALVSHDSRPKLQRATREPSAAPGPSDAGPIPAPVPTPTPAAGLAPVAPSFICGPDVTAPLTGALSALRSAWAGWNADQKDEACWALENAYCGPDAWDIVELHNNRWISAAYQPLGCATTGATPHCGESVQVGTDCHFAPGVNYVVFGAMCKLCDIWPSTMKLMIWGHKVHWSGMDPDYESSKRWAQAGYDGWPASATPAGDRNNCWPSCAAPPPSAFDFHWFPSHTTETVGSGCPPALLGHRAMRDNPPDIGTMPM
jgi:hypothetical protein